ncbi:ABC transporter permease [Conexibacter sp. JD483]|uniref:ABC transporter permease n=1 Tax=unclassified Conexibacter TaxID=2627773 RepID=UPI00271F3B2D|nr:MULTISPECIES: ABC transporter permease [unclassified Conexibacter]MDO8185589.1 ABC transporter permease [Conexibacter sp. CPCC 205706]MDO8198762.1 ABC transporter permease [Conexibacter sp. CPCC 205762]MDR9367888.1 ABC transporter permease [Conexibacter sp. JD483]
MSAVDAALPPSRLRRFKRSRSRSAARSWWRQPTMLIGLTIAAIWIVVAIFAPLLAPHDPLAQDFAITQAPSGAHPFGTDELGRDILSRVLVAARNSLPLAVLLVLCAGTLGTTLGVVAGYVGGWVDGLIMRLADLFSAFPAIVLAMVVTASLGPSTRNAVLALVTVTWPIYARVVRSLVLSIGQAEYVQAFRLHGASARRAMWKEVLPNVMGPIIVLATIYLADALLLLAGLSFLGLGTQPPTPEWGSMISVGTQYFQNWWMATFPGLAIFSAALAFNFIGDGLRDVFDPQSQIGSGARGGSESVEEDA